MVLEGRERESGREFLHGASPARKGGSVSLKGWPQLGAAAGELNLLSASSGALRHGPRPVPSRAPIPVMLAQRAWRLADKLGPCPTLPAATELGLTRPARAAARRPAG